MFSSEVQTTWESWKSPFFPKAPVQFGTSISVFKVHRAMAESTGISRPAYSVYETIPFLKIERCIILSGFKPTVHKG